MLAEYRRFGAFGAALVLLRACCPGRAELMSPCVERRCMVGRCLCLDQAFNSSCLDGARNPHAAAFLYALIDAVPKDRTARVEQICLISKSLRQTYEALHERDARNMTKLLEQVALVTDGYRALGRRVHCVGVTFYDVFMHLARDALLEMDACPSATPSRTLMWFVSSRDVDAALNVKLALAAIEAESRGWGLKIMHTSRSKAVVDSVERALPAHCRSRLESVSLASMGINLPRIRRGQLSCLQASKIYFEGTRDTVVIAGGEDVMVRRPISDQELSYTMLGAPWTWCRAPKHKNTDECRFGGNGGFAIRNPAFVAEHGIQARPKVEGFKAWARECGTMHHNDDIYLAIKMNELYVGSCVLRARPNAPATLLANFLST